MVLFYRSRLKCSPPFYISLYSPDSLSIPTSLSPCLDNFSCHAPYPHTFPLTLFFSHSTCSKRMVLKPIFSSCPCLKCLVHILYCQLETSSWIFFRYFKLNTYFSSPLYVSVLLMALSSSEVKSS